MKRLVLYFAGCVLAIGCILNPQPHPPDQEGSSTPSIDSGAPINGGVYDAGASDGPTAIIIGAGSGDATAAHDVDGAVDTGGSTGDATEAGSVDAADAGTAADAEAGALDDADAGVVTDAAPATDASDADEWCDAIDGTARGESD